MAATERDEVADIAKGIGILFVIAGHCGFELKDFSAYTFHMPLFFFISGFFISSFINNPSIDSKTFIRRRFMRLMLPFFIYNLIFGLFSWASQFTGLRITTGSLTEVMSLHNIFIEPFLSNHQFQISCSLWFVPALFCALLFIALLRPVLRYCTSHPVWVPFFLAAIVMLYYGCAAANDVFPYNFRFLARNIIGCIYIMLGYFYYISPLPRIDVRIMLLIGLGIYFVIALKLGHITFFMLNNEYGSNVSRFASLPSSLAGILIILSLSRLIASPQTFIQAAGFGYLGRVSYHVMAIHLSCFLLLNCLLCLLRYRPLSLIDSAYFRFPNCVPLYFIFGVVGSYWYAKILGRIKVAPWRRLILFWETDPNAATRLPDK